ncbi:MAG: hypothetical protein SGCHY_003899 [Lobulomycetales sp.]
MSSDADKTVASQKAAEFEELTGFPSEQAKSETEDLAKVTQKKKAARKRAKVNDISYLSNIRPEIVEAAIATIFLAWKSYQNKRIFQHLKSLIFLAEAGFTIDMLKKICPRELEYLSDPCCRGRLRFRFGGEAFPPGIYFKIFTKGMHVQYMNGRLLIPPGSIAARESCLQMGNRQFAQNIYQVERILEKHEIVDPEDITTKQEYTKYMAALDHHIPTNAGGRNNDWRELELNKFPPHRLFYDLTSVKRSLLKNTIRELFKIRQNSAQVPGRSPADTARRHSRHSASSIKKIKLQKILAVYGFDKQDSGQRKQEELGFEEPGTDFEEEDDEEREFNDLFEWANELNEKNELVDSVHDYKHKIDFLY